MWDDRRGDEYDPAMRFSPFQTGDGEEEPSPQGNIEDSYKNSDLAVVLCLVVKLVVSPSSWMAILLELALVALLLVSVIRGRTLLFSRKNRDASADPEQEKRRRKAKNFAFFRLMLLVQSLLELIYSIRMVYV